VVVVRPRTFKDSLDLYMMRYKSFGPYARPLPPVRKYDFWWDKNTCEYCGRTEQTLKVPLEVVLCREHFDRAYAKEKLKAEGRVQVITNLSGELACSVCGRREPVMYLVRFNELCYYCLWRTFGHQKGPLKADGVRVL